MPRVVTEIDLDLAKEQAKIAQLKLDLKSVEAEARKVKIGENLVTREAAAEAARIAQLKQQIATAAFEGGLKELAPAQQLYAITQQIARLKAQAYDAGPIRESQALQVEIQTAQLAQRRAAIMAGMQNERQQSLAIAQRELAVQAQQSAEARRLLGIEEIQNAAAQRRALLSSVAASASQRGGGRGFAVQNAAFQVADIGVGLQAGTSPITIATQQLPQLLSALGPAGAVAGAGTALAGVMLTVGKHSKDAFAEMIDGARKSHEEIGQLLQSGGINELSRAMVKLDERAAAFSATRANLYSVGSQTSTLLGMVVGGKSTEEKKGDIAKEEARIAFDRNAMQTRALALSERELQITKLKANARELEIAQAARISAIQLGQGARAEELANRISQLKASGGSFEAEEISRRIASEEKIASIKAAGYDQDTKDRLIAIAESERIANQYAAWTEERKRRDDEIAATREKQSLRIIKLAQDEGAEWAKIASLKKQAADRDLETALKGLRPQDQAAMLEKQAAGLAASARDQGPVQASTELEVQSEINRLLERAGEIRKDESKRAAEIAFSRAELDLENKILEAKGKSLGKDTATVTALDDKLKAMRLARQYQDNYNVSAQTALNMANARVTAENNIANAIKQQAEAQNNLAQRLKLAQLQGSGRNVAAAKLQQQSKEDSLTKEVQDSDPALTPERARAKARELIKAEDRADRRQARNEARENGTPLPRSKIVTNAPRVPDRFGDPTAGAGGLKPLWAQGIGQLAVNQGPAGQQLQQANQNAANQQALNNNVFSMAEGPSIISLLTAISQNLVVAN